MGKVKSVGGKDYTQDAQGNWYEVENPVLKEELKVKTVNGVTYKKDVDGNWYTTDEVKKKVGGEESVQPSQSKSISPSEYTGTINFNELNAMQGGSNRATPQQEEIAQYGESVTKGAIQKREDDITDAATNTAKLYFENNPSLLKNYNLSNKKATGDKFSLTQLRNATPFQQKVADLKTQIKEGNLITYTANTGEKRVARPMGKWDNLKTGIDEAWNANKKADEYLNLSDIDKIKFLKEFKPDKDFLPEKADVESGMYQLGSAIPSTGKLLAAGATGAVMSAAIPETGGLSTAGLPAVLAWASIVPDMAKQHQVNSEIEAFHEAKRNNPNISDEDALKMAKKAGVIGYASGLAKGTLMNVVGQGSLPPNTGQGLLKATGQFLKNQPQSIAEVGGLSLGTSFAESAAKKAIGIDEDFAEKAGKILNNDAISQLAFNVAFGVAAAPKYVKAQANEVLSKMDTEALQMIQQRAIEEGLITEQQATDANRNLQQYKEAKSKMPPMDSEEKTAVIAGLIQKKQNLEKAKSESDKSFHDEFDAQIEAADQRIQLAKKSNDPIKYAEQDDLDGTKNFTPKSFESLSKKEVDGIAEEVPKEYGEAEAVEVGGYAEGSAKKYKAEATVTRQQGFIKIKDKIAVDDKVYNDKADAEAAAQKALARHYYENAMDETLKPEQKSSVTVIRPEENKAPEIVESKSVVEEPVSSVEGEKSGGGSITFENAKEGDTVVIGGQKVEVVGRTKSRGGNDVVEVKSAKRTKEEIREAAVQRVINEKLKEYNGRKVSMEQFEQDFAPEIRDAIDQETALENSRTATFTIDAEQWASEVQSNETKAQTEKPIIQTMEGSRTGNEPIPAETQSPSNAIIPETTQDTGTQPPIPTKPSKGGVTVIYPKTQLSHAGTEKISTEHGFENENKYQKSSVLKWNKEADDLIANNFDIKGMLDKVDKGEHVISPAERVVLTRFAAELEMRLHSTKDPSSAEYDRTLRELKRVTDMANFSNSQSGANLGAIGHIKTVAEGSYADFMLTELDANNGADLTNNQKAKALKDYTEYQQAKNKEAETYADLEDNVAKDKAEKVFNEKAKKAKAEKSTPKKSHDDYVKERTSLRDELKAAKEKHIKWLKDNGIQQQGASPFVLTTDMVKVIKKMIDSYFNEGVHKLADVTKSVYEEAKDILDGITERHIHDIIAGEYNEKKQSKTELAIQKENLRIQAQAVNKLERLLNGTQPKNEMALQKRNQEIKDLREQIKDFEKEENEANKFYGESDTAERRIEGLQDELERVKARKEKEPVEKNKRELSNREQSIKDEIELEKELWAKEKAVTDNIKKLETELERVTLRKQKEQKENNTEQPELTEKEKELTEKINEQKKKWDAEKKSAADQRNSYKKLETERNRQLDRVEGLKAKISQLKSGVKSVTEKSSKKDVAEIEALKKELKEEEKKFNEMVAAEKRIFAKQKELQRLKDLKEKDPKENIKKAISDKEEKLNKEIEEERKIFKEKAPSAIRKALETVKTKNENETNRIQGLLDKGEYSPDVKKTPLMQQEEVRNKYPAEYKAAVAAKDARIKKQHEIAIRRAEQMYKNRTPQEKTLEVFSKSLNIPRTLMTVGDFSAVFRQAAVATTAHPVIASKALKFMFEAAGNEKLYNRWLEDVHNDPFWETAEKSKLPITDPASLHTKEHEEAYYGSQYAEKAPVVGEVVKASERAYNGYINFLRWEMFKMYAEKFQREGKTYDNNKKLYDGLSSFIGSATGRGGMKVGESAAPILNWFLFASRLIASRVNMLGLSDIPNLLVQAGRYGVKGATLGKFDPKWGLDYGFYTRLPKEIRITAAKDMLKFLGVGMTTLILAKQAGLEVELDPRSSDFGKIKDGNTRWDVWGGFQPYARLTAQIITGQSKSANTGKVYDLDGEKYGGRDVVDQIGTFARGKASPIVGMGLDILTRRTLDQKTLERRFDIPFYSKDNADEGSITLTDEMIQHLLPLLWQDVAEAMKDRGTSAIFTVGIPSLFGIGVQTYEPHKSKSKKKKPVSNY